MNPHLAAASAPVVIPLVVTLGYALACWIWPFKPCRRCSGLGKRRPPSGRAFRYCRRCKGTGARLRAGRWIYNHFTRIRRDGAR